MEKLTQNKIEGLVKERTKELRSQFESLKELDQRKDEFIAILGHELRNPLMPLMNAVELLRRDDSIPKAEQAKLLEVAAHQTDHMARLLKYLLDASRILRGKITLEKELVDLNTVAAHAAESARPLIDEIGHVFRLAFAKEPLMVNADVVRTEQAIVNILSNAAKYTEPGGTIRLATERAGSEALVRITDTGIGIAPDMLEKIFTFFVQLDPAHAVKKGGLGIGLVLARSFMRLHGGDVTAHSEGTGKGSEFVIRLPLAQVKAVEPAPQALPPRPIARLLRKRVLVVDDNKELADTLAQVLETAGQEAAVAYSGSEALRRAEAFRPDAVFLDIAMPHMDGYAVAQALREREHGHARARIIALTGYGQTVDKRRSKRMGFDMHLVKPVDMNGILAALGPA